MGALWGQATELGPSPGQGELVLVRGGRERIGELGDVLEVIRALAALEGAGLEGVIRAAEEKRRERGGFEERIFLEKVVSRGKAAE